MTNLKPPITNMNTPEPMITAPLKQPKNPSHFGWAELAQRIPVKCFSNDPSVKSSLKFLRKTPWARDKVEQLYMVISV
jgi:uncharacterized protein (DUF2132 family)